MQTKAIIISMKLFSGNGAWLSNNSILRKLPDIFYVLLFMYLGEALLQNPVFGLAAGLLITFWQSFTFAASMRRGLESRAVRITGIIMLIIVMGANIALFLIFPDSVRREGCALLFAFAVLVLIKNFISAIIASSGMSHARRLFVLTAFHLIIACAYTVGCFLLLPADYIPTASAGYIIIDLFLLIRMIKHPPLRKNVKATIASVSSYRLFSQMSLYVSISFYLAIFMFMGYIITMPNENGINAYTLMLVWICFVGLLTFLFYKLTRKISRPAGIGFFITGALAWVFSSYKLFYASGIVDGILWSGFFAAGLALMYSGLYRLNENFRRVSCIIDEDISTDELMQSTELVQSFAFSFSAVVLIAVLIISPYSFSDPYQERLFSASTTLLPFIFIILSILLALRQPLDAASLDKLERIKSGRGDSEMKQYLQNILVKKYRKRYGVRIIAFFLKPFIYHKVYGRENVSDESLPAVFVCNHGEIYGPVVAVTHLPYYFRPWTQAKMLSYDQAKEHIYGGTFANMKMPYFLKRAIACICAHAAVWALNSFDPVPVYLGNIREIYKTMQASVQVLAEGDSLLLFPENPGSEKDGRYVADGTVGAFYSGFVQIGIEYYKKYGKSVTFYPIFASKSKRTFRIGKGTVFSPKANRHEEKLRVAAELQAAMQELSEL